MVLALSAVAETLRIADSEANRYVRRYGPPSSPAIDKDDLRQTAALAIVKHFPKYDKPEKKMEPGRLMRTIARHAILMSVKVDVLGSCRHHPSATGVSLARPVAVEDSVVELGDTLPAPGPSPEQLADLRSIRRLPRKAQLCHQFHVAGYGLDESATALGIANGYVSTLLLTTLQPRPSQQTVTAAIQGWIMSRASLAPGCALARAGCPGGSHDPDSAERRMIAAIEIGRHLDEDEQKVLALFYMGPGEMISTTEAANWKAPPTTTWSRRSLRFADAGAQLGWPAGRVKRAITTARLKVARAIQRGGVGV